MNRNRIYKTFACTVFLWGFCGWSFAQIGHGGTPYSFNKKPLDTFSVAVLPALDNQLLLAQEEITDKEDGYPFGKEIAVDFRLDNAGSWEDLPNGGRLWRLGIESKEAHSINLIFDSFYIPSASHLFIYTADRSFVLGSFTVKNNNRWGNFATTLLPGDAIVLEFYEAAQDKNNAIINLSTVIHGYKDFFFNKNNKQQKGTYGNSASCNVNINCEIGIPFQDVKRAVALILRGTHALCSGTLINNTAQDRTPYFLTAHHCYSLSGFKTSNWVFIFNYESDCEDNKPTATYSINGATVVASCDTSDFCLLLLNDIPPVEYNPYYAGWNRKDILYTRSAGIHHPQGDFKKISASKETLEHGKGKEEKTEYPDSTHYVVSWDKGLTQYVSSGSALFNLNSLIIGQLDGGWIVNCNDSLRQDWYGKIAYSWTNGNHSDSNRLDYWLDPLGLGVDSLKGLGTDSLIVKDSSKHEKRISVYPNPVATQLHIRSEDMPLKNLAIYDMIGRKMVEQTAIQSHECVLNMESLHAGLYMLKIETENGFFTKKIGVIK